MFSLRLASAVLGIITIPIAWRLFRSFVGPAAGLTAAAFLAFSPWHITLSRIGFGPIAVPLFDVIIIFAVFRAVASKSWIWFAIAGVATALTNYGYFSSRLSILLLAAACWLLIPRHTPEKSKPYLGIAVAVFALVISLVPLWIHFLGHPEELTQRAAQVTVLQDVAREKSVKQILSTTRATLRMFFERGDLIARHNLPGAPMLDVVIGSLFFIGLIALIIKPGAGWEKLLLVWLVLPLFFGGVLTTPAPHGLRTFSSLVPICLIAAMGLESMLSLAPAVGLRRALRVGAVLLPAILAYRQYFIVYPAHPDTRAAFSPHAYQVGKYIAKMPSDEPVMVSTSFSPDVVRFIVNDTKREISFFEQPSDLDAKQGITYFFVRESDVPESFKTMSCRSETVTMEEEQFVICRLKEQ